MIQKFITILPRFSNPPINAKSKLFLKWDDWNDYSFHTLFGVLYVDDKSSSHDLDGIRIGFYGQVESQTKLKVGDNFDELPNEYFSLGSEDFYENLNQLGKDIRDKVLTALRDIAKDPSIYDKAINEKVTRVSLLRGRTETEVTGQLRRMANGGIRLIAFMFSFECILGSNSNKVKVHLQVKPDSRPPTNVHVIIGRNGTGKTTLLHNMIKALFYPNEFDHGQFTTRAMQEEFDLFPNLIWVSFSAFDEANVAPIDESNKPAINYAYIGLRTNIFSKAGNITLKTPQEIQEEFFESLYQCKEDQKVERWQTVVEILHSDPFFEEENIINLIIEDQSIKSIKNRNERKMAFKKKVLGAFSQLSSGHKIVLLSITKLVEKLEEKSLVLLDEPETHLHPPLLAAYIRSLSELLVSRNGVAIIATHSPVILQEVPKNCIWKIRRNGAIAQAERLDIESFGENVGTLTREVFRLEVTESGFYKYLSQMVNDEDTYEDVVEKFNEQLGLEALSILRSLFMQKENRR